MSSSQSGGQPGNAATIFVLGLLGIVVCGILAPIAWVMGNTYRRECERVGVEPDGLATAGWVMGIIGTILIGVVIVIAILVFVVTVALAPH